MSSKSRHDHDHKNEAHAPIEHVDGGIAEAPSVDDFLGEETIHVPEGKSRFQFIFLIGLLIFLLIIFIIPGAFQNVFSPNEGNSLPVVSWETPAGPMEWNSTEFMMEKRAEAAYLSIYGMRGTPSEEAVATTLMLDTLAQEAGVVVPDKQVVEIIRGLAEALGGTEAYKLRMKQAFAGGTKTYERVARRQLRIGKYQTMLSRIAIAPPASRLEAEWHKAHELAAFDYIETATDLYTAAALVEVPNDEGLEVWFNARPDYEKNSFKSAEKWTIGSAFYRLGDEAPAVLAERFPMAEDWDAEAEALRFYQTYSYLMFRLEEEITDENGEITRYVPQEDVDADCRSYSSILASIKAWNEDVTARTAAGEVIPFAKEAAELGLGWHVSVEPMGRTELLADTEFGGGILSSQLLNTEPGQLLKTAIVGKQTIQVAKVMSRQEPTLPEFSTFRDDIANRWADERSGGLAVEALEALTAAESLTAEAFEALTADNPAFTMGMRDWLDTSGSFADDPNGMEPANLFISLQGASIGLNELEEGELAAAALGTSKTSAFLVRSMGKQAVPFGDANPGQLQQLSDAADRSARTSLMTAFMPIDDILPAYLVENYKMSMPSRDQAIIDRAKEEAELAAAAATEE
jgi:hypothetical protein